MSEIQAEEGEYTCSEFLKSLIGNKAKSIMMCNKLPTIDMQDEGIARRIRVIPFARIQNPVPMSEAMK